MEVLITLSERQTISSYLTLSGEHDRPEGVREGTWYRLERGTLDFVDLAEFIPIWNMLPIEMREMIYHSKRTAPKGEKAFPPYLYVMQKSARCEDFRPWKKEDW